MNNIKSTPANM